MHHLMHVEPYASAHEGFYKDNNVLYIYMSMHIVRCGALGIWEGLICLG
jgi:hypothetical protein